MTRHSTVRNIFIGLRSCRPSPAALAALYLLVAACSPNPKDVYHYEPEIAGEVPATLRCRTVAIWSDALGIGIRTTRARAAITQINGKDTLLYESSLSDLKLSMLLVGETAPEHPKITTFKIPPGPTTLTMVVSPANAQGADVTAKLSFDAKAGEAYTFNGGGHLADFNVWLKDSSGKRIISDTFHVRYGP